MPSAGFAGTDDLRRAAGLAGPHRQRSEAVAVETAVSHSNQRRHASFDIIIDAFANRA
jgi:hypothetical protein